MPSSDTWFKPGNPGGPGKKPGSSSLRTLLKKKLEEASRDKAGRTVIDEITGKPVKYADALINATLRDALKGDSAARRLIWEYVDGKAPVDADSGGGAEESSVHSFLVAIKRAPAEVGELFEGLDSEPIESPEDETGGEAE